jgi:hypothetical protein
VCMFSGPLSIYEVLKNLCDQRGTFDPVFNRMRVTASCRCRYCREVCYCSAACESANARQHAQLHALRLMFFKRNLVFGTETDYVALEL